MIFIIDQCFFNRSRSEFNVSHSIIFSPVNILCSKNSQVSLGTWKRGLLCINMHFTLKLYDWDMYYAKKVLSIKLQKLALFSLTLWSTLNGLIRMWSIILVHIITLPPSWCLLLAKGMKKLDQFYSLVHPSSPSKVTWDFSIKMTTAKSIFMYLLTQFWCFKIFASIKGCLEICLQIRIHKVFYTFCPFWLPQFQHFQNFESLSIVMFLLYLTLVC